MKNKRKAHAGIIENFLEQSQQDQVVRHDLIDMHSVSFDIYRNSDENSIFQLKLFLFNISHLHWQQSSGAATEI